ncbi:DUF1643 domain-containing protein [Paenisporosarcina quisquiliarum]|uniref:DUF1643 domain-containing protein n=1 Tax=Paenisporosarcina quisquiliarum TaxID=365346 RepID=A0A9X3LGG1_9BACL|nr:DUF1643 domain-containing protein [Paenisporosarcina quisquiliarum]
MWIVDIADANKLMIYRGEHKGINGIAIFDPDKQNRSFLEKRWAEAGSVLTAFMMNPSKAAHNDSDPTVDQLINVAKKKGCNALNVVNVSSLIDGNSKNIKGTHFQYNQVNWEFISNTMKRSDYVLLGWGVKGQLGILDQLKMQPSIKQIFDTEKEKLYAYEVLKSNDKKYKHLNLYYAPHPRPQTNIKRYIEAPIVRIENFDFEMLFK